MTLAGRLDRQRFVLFIRASNPSCGGCGIHECFGLLGPTRDLWCRAKARFVCPHAPHVRAYPFLCSHAMPCHAMHLLVVGGFELTKHLPARIGICMRPGPYLPHACMISPYHVYRLQSDRWALRWYYLVFNTFSGLREIKGSHWQASRVGTVPAPPSHHSRPYDRGNSDRPTW